MYPLSRLFNQTFRKTPTHVLKTERQEVKQKRKGKERQEKRHNHSYNVSIQDTIQPKTMSNIKGFRYSDHIYLICLIRLVYLYIYEKSSFFSPSFSSFIVFIRFVCVVILAPLGPAFQIGAVILLINKSHIDVCTKNNSKTASQLP